MEAIHKLVWSDPIGTFAPHIINNGDVVSIAEIDNACYAIMFRRHLLQCRDSVTLSSDQNKSGIRNALQDVERERDELKKRFPVIVERAERAFCRAGSVIPTPERRREQELKFGMEPNPDFAPPRSVFLDFI